jgi:multidrug efflux system outer membrane protein
MKNLVVPSLTAAWLAACSVVPAYTPPQAQTPNDWQAELPHQGNTTNMLNWWSQFNDPLLAELLSAAQQDHPSLEKAAAAIAEARATLSASQAAKWPNLNGTLSNTRSSSVNALGREQLNTTRTSALDSSWEIDLFGRIQYSNAANEAKAQARVSDWHNARISLAAEVANTYVNYRACRLQLTAFQAEQASQQDTEQLNASLVKAGLTAPAEAKLAAANVASSNANVFAQQEVCDITIKTLVGLTGLAEKELRNKLQSAPSAIPQPKGFEVNAIPAVSISQRPDVISAERALAAAHADTGASEAARYPRLALAGAITAAVVSGTSLNTWSFGPALSMPLLDGGQRKAVSEAAQARYTQALSTYKSTVRSAIEETEKALVRLQSLQHKQAETQAAAKQYRAYLESAETNWKAGGLSLLDLENIRRNSIAADINAIAFQRDQVNAWIVLYKALGGGWQEHASLESNTP